MELERTPDLEQARRLLFPDLPPEEGWKQIELALQGALDKQRWRRIQQLAATDDDADLALDLTARARSQRQAAPLEPEQRERGDRFRLIWLRADTLINAGFTREQAAQLAPDFSVAIADALALLDAGVPAADAAAQLREQRRWRPQSGDHRRDR